MKVISLNMWVPGTLFAEARDFLVSEQPDIMLLQEVYNGTRADIELKYRGVQELQKVFPEYFTHFAPVYQDTRPVEGNIDDGQVIVSRYPLSQTQALYLDVPYGPYFQDDPSNDFTKFPVCIQTAVADIHGNSVKLINVHGPVWYAGTEDTPRRLKMRELILKEREGAASVILAGDFNVQPATQTVRELGAGLQNVFAGELTSTFNMRRKDNPGYATAVVDMMFVSPDWQVVSHVCPDVDVSDHYPLVAELSATN